MELALINYQLVWRGWGGKGGLWAVGGRSPLINESYRSDRALLRVIKVNLSWHTAGRSLQERMSGYSWDGGVGDECVSCRQLIHFTVSYWQALVIALVISFNLEGLTRVAE